MNVYTYFSEVYDTFMDNIPYEEWAEYIITILKNHDINEGLILDLGCGTGTFAEILAGRGYDLIGIDSSQEMLAVAADKKYESGHDILYLCQDMREIELYGTVKAVICACDSMNYLTNRQDLIKVFRLVNNYLDPDGLFIFDISTSEKYEKINDTVIAENREECSFIWENTYYEENHINQYDLTLFMKDENGKYDKAEEVHVQKAYSFIEIKEAAQEAGLKFLDAYDSYTSRPFTDESERICFICRENGKV
jgi:2-polyprenyl-3-methyl-5-hydroxy-6-metoxy-1,4-benzoquinol methylase